MKPDSNDINDIKDVIRNAVQKYLNIHVVDDDKNLLSTDFHVIIADLLYVLEELERHYGSCIYHLFERNNYSVFTINGLAQAIANLCGGEVDSTSCS